LRDRITRLRTENEQLRLHLDLYEEHIRRLTIENTRLTAELVRRGSVTDLASRRDGGSGA
jgi:predicted nuclease with TOPRIM domain